MKTLTLDIVTQEKRILTKEVESVSVETVEGEITILPEHQPLMTRLSEGILHYVENGQEDVIAIFGGFLEVGEDSNVNVLADSATRAENIDIAKVERARDEAKKALENKTSEKEFLLAEAALRKTALELKAAKRLQSRRLN